MHPNVYPNGLAIDDHNGWSDVERVRQLMVDNGDGAKNERLQALKQKYDPDNYFRLNQNIPPR
jgi:Berberine and berberine like